MITNVLKLVLLIVGVLIAAPMFVVATVTLPVLILAAAVLVALKWLWRRWKAFVAWYQRMYCDEIWRERHRVEEKARALGALRLPEWPS